MSNAEHSRLVGLGNATARIHDELEGFTLSEALDIFAVLIAEVVAGADHIQDKQRFVELAGAEVGRKAALVIAGREGQEVGQ